MTTLIRVIDGVADRYPVPDNLIGLQDESLADLSWLDPACEMVGWAWFPEAVVPVEIAPHQIADGTETLTFDSDNQVVLSRTNLRNKTPEELAASQQAVKDQIAALAHQLNVRIFSRLSDLAVLKYGHEQREAAALAYRDAGYEGEESEWITSFSVNAGMSYRDAVDLILHQADGTRAAVAALETLRMQRYAIIKCETLSEAEAMYATMTASVDAVVIP